MVHFVLRDLIYDTATTAVYTGYLENPAGEIIIKIPKGSDYSGIYNEYTILSREELPCRVYSIEHINNQPVLLRSYLPGVSLKSLIGQGQSGPAFFFTYALHITRQLLEVHNRSIIHKDISSFNILVDTATQETYLIDFESSTKSHATTAFHSAWLSGNLSYISPEQTGRMNRIVDYRTDYYSLGIVFFEMLTGQLPFPSTDMLELVHCHLARKLPRLQSLNPAIPEMLTRIVDKLTAKNAEERYQSLSGLLADLDRCREEWTSEQKISMFELGQHDFPVNVNISQKMVGRANEAATMNRLFEQAATGKNVFLTVGGGSGSGKSTLIHETTRPLTRDRGHILQGKFDPLQKNIPYSAWIQAFEQFADFMLTQPPAELEKWQTRFEEALQNLGLILVQLVPKLSRFFGSAAELPRLSGIELKNRLHYAIGLFLQVLSSAEHPLILFLDDWQWADEDSIRLLTTVRNNPQLTHLLLIATYRTNEIHVAHPFYPLTQSAENSEVAGIAPTLMQESMVLSPLTEEHIREILDQTLVRYQQHLDALARSICSKTQGNPFFAGQFLTLLHERGLLWMNTARHQWEWNLTEILALDLSDNVVEVILKKMQAFPAETLHTLTVASVAGSTFSLENLAKVLQKTPSELHRVVWPAIQTTCILPTLADYKFVPDFYETEKTDVSFRFAHDRIQQTLYEELPAAEREQWHFTLGSLLIAVSENPPQLFEAANHFLKGRRLIAGSSQASAILNLLQQAGTKAYQAAAFDISFHYFSLWESLVTEHDASSLPRYWMLIETAYLSNWITQADSYESKALQLCQSQEERSQTYQTIIKSCAASGQLEKANQITRTALAELGIRIPYKAAKWQVIYAALRSRVLISDKKIASLPDWPDMTDSRYSWAMRLLLVSLPSYFLAEFETYPLLLFKMTDLNARYGKSRESIIGFGSYGLILAGMLQAPDSGYMAGKQAMKLLENYKAEELNAQAGFVDCTFIAHWKEPIAALAQRCLLHYQQGLAIGDIQYAGWNLYIRSILHFYVGTRMSVMLDGMRAQEHFFRQHNLTNMLEKSVHERHFMHLLHTPDYTNADFDWEAILHTFQQNHDLTGLFTLYSHHTICSLFLGDVEKAWEVACLARKHSETVRSIFSFSIFTIYHTLAGLNIYASASHALKRQIRRVIRGSRAGIRNMAHRQPENYAWGPLLIEAEHERVINNHFDPANYHAALDAAQKGKMLFPAVMIRLQLVRLLLETQHPSGPGEYLKVRAELLNMEMGGVLARLDAQYPQAAPSPDFLETHPVTSVQRSGYISPLQFDTQTLIKSIEALTGDLQLDKLLNRLMAFALENAGADYGCFLLRRDQQFRPVVAMYADGTPAPLHQGPEPLVPVSIFNYVVQSGEVLRLGNASATLPYANDPGIIQQQEHSVLCIPFVNQGQINGVIYLTNRLTENAFTDQRVGLLKLLAGQISLSIENAMLYENLENLVAERTRQLEAEKKKSDLLLLNILPEQVANELKQSGKARPRYYEQVTIMFCDFKDFTSFAESQSPESLLETLDRCFKAFDTIIRKYPIEKIKTMGDAYLCVSGLPQQNPTHARDMIRAAMELQHWIEQETRQMEKAGQRFLQLRIGIHTGSVVAGVVGDSKFAYDIWGDAVNIAARLEESGTAGHINISSATYGLIRECFHCVHRGKIKAKNKGEIEMYYVEKEIQKEERAIDAEK